jgi:hypothetical protein
MDFSVLVQRTQLGPRSFPLRGLQDLEPEWQETVIEIITKPPVNQMLRVSSYTPSMTEESLLHRLRSHPLRSQFDKKALQEFCRKFGF